MYKLYVVSTPIGNILDITMRALQVLRAVSAVACEDPRVTMKIFNHYEIPIPRMVTYNEHKKVDEVMGLLMRGDVALTSDAGTPLVSDPGHLLVRVAVECGVQIVPIPGCSSVAAALVVSALDIHDFAFVSFMPRTKGDAENVLYKFSHTVIVALERGSRLLATLNMVGGILGYGHNIVIARELTKIYESIYRDTIRNIMNMLSSEPIRGEIVLIIDRCPHKPTTDDRLIDTLIQFYSTRSANDIVSAICDLLPNVSKRHVYQKVISARTDNKINDTPPLSSA